MTQCVGSKELLLNAQPSCIRNLETSHTIDSYVLKKANSFSQIGIHLKIKFIQCVFMRAACVGYVLPFPYN